MDAKTNLANSSEGLSGYHAKKLIGSILVHLITVIVCLFFFLPFLVMIMTSLKTEPECYIYPIRLFPESFINFTAYKAVFGTIPFLLYFRNTGLIVIVNIIGVMFSCPLVAYSLSRINWRGKNFLFLATLAVMMIPYQSIMVPLFLIYRNLGLVGTYGPLMIQSFFGAPFFIFLLRQFFMSLPKELEDAARIDGCPEFGIYWRIFLPLMKPAIVTIMIMQLLNSWNDFQGPLIYLQSSSMYTLSIGLQQFKEQHKTRWPELTAAATMMSAPIIILFFFAQKQFMEGITFSGIKG